MSAGKGDKVRPFDRARYEANFDSINWKRKQPEECESTPRSETFQKKCHFCTGERVRSG